MKLLMIGFKLAFSHFTFPSARSHFLFPVLVTSILKQLQKTWWLGNNYLRLNFSRSLFIFVEINFTDIFFNLTKIIRIIQRTLMCFAACCSLSTSTKKDCSIFDINNLSEYCYLTPGKTEGDKFAHCFRQIQLDNYRPQSKNNRKLEPSRFSVLAQCLVGRIYILYILSYILSYTSHQEEFSQFAVHQEKTPLRASIFLFN